jgi:methylthioribulose-1-phosphate dehydratase
MLEQAVLSCETESVENREDETRRQICELLSLFYHKGWVTGTGGGICADMGHGEVLLAPTGVHKERVRPEDLFVVDRQSGQVLRPPENKTLRPSECGGIFGAILGRRVAGSVLHSPALPTVLAGDLANGTDRIVLSHLEMLKGIRGVANTDRHAVAVIDNTARECELVARIQTVLDDPRFATAYCILVRDHGAYVWGADLWEAKRHAEAYHFLCEATVARATRLAV